MDAKHFETLVGALTAAGTRRRLLGVLSSGLLVPGLHGLGIEETDARRRGKRKRRRKTQAKRKRQEETNQEPPLDPPPPSPPPPPAPVTQADATCPGNGPAVLVVAEENSRLAQTFTALASGPLVRADIRISKPVGAGGDFVLRLSPVRQSGEVRPPTNDVLAETDVAEASVPGGSSTVTFAFATPFSVAAGTTYALVLTRPEGGKFAWVGSSVDLCPGGAFVSPNQTGGFLDLGSDLFFTTFVTS